MINSKIKLKRSICTLFLACLLVPAFIAAVPESAYAFTASQTRSVSFRDAMGTLRTATTDRFARSQSSGTNTGSRNFTVRKLACRMHLTFVNQVPSRYTTVRPGQSGIRSPVTQFSNAPVWGLPRHKSSINALLFVRGSMNIQAGR